MGEYREDGARDLLRCSRRMKGNGHKLEYEKFLTQNNENISIM